MSRSLGIPHLMVLSACVVGCALGQALFELPSSVLMSALLWLACARWALYARRGEREVCARMGLEIPGGGLWLVLWFGALLLALDRMLILFATLPETLLLGQARLVLLSALLAIFANRLRFDERASDRAQLGFACWLLSLLLIEPGARETWREFATGVLQMIGTLAMVAAIRAYLVQLVGRTQHAIAASSLRTALGSIVLVSGFLLLSWTGVQRAVALEQTGVGVARESMWLESVVAPSDKVAQAIQQEVAKHLLNSTVDSTKPAKSAVDSGESKPGAKLTWKKPTAILVTVSDGRTRGVTSYAFANSATAAIEQVVASAREAAPKAVTGVRVDVVSTVRVLEFGEDEDELSSDEDVRINGFKRGTHGLALEAEWGLVFSPGQVVTTDLVSRQQRLDREVFARALNMKSETHKEAWAAVDSGMFRAFIFDTRSAYLTRSSRVPLVRGHRMFQDVQPAELLGAAQGGGEYLIRTIEDDGEFLYSYRAHDDVEEADYNMLRHAGTAYSLLELYEVDPDAELMEAIERSLNYMDDRIGIYPHDETEQTDVLVDGDAIKVGGNALAAIAICKYMELTQDHNGIETLERLCQWLVDRLEPDGQFELHKQSYESGDVYEFQSEYYPGEALLALVRTHAIDQDEKWLDAAERIASFLIGTRDAHRSSRELPHDHWLLYGLNELHRARPKAMYLDHARKIVDAILAKQRVDERIPDWVGSYYRPPRTTPTATRSEGLCAAYALERDFGSDGRAERILEGIQKGVRFQLQTQFRAESVIHLPNPRKPLGGFHKGLDDFTVRIDYVQHNISALLGLKRILESRP